MHSLFLLHEERLKPSRREKKNQHTYRSDKKWKKAPECFIDHQNSKCHKEQQPLELSFTDKLDLCKIENDFRSKNDEHHNQFGRLTEADFI